MSMDFDIINKNIDIVVVLKSSIVFSLFSNVLLYYILER